VHAQPSYLQHIWTNASLQHLRHEEHRGHRRAHTFSNGMSLSLYFSLICCQVPSCCGRKSIRGILRGEASSTPNHSANAGHSCNVMCLINASWRRRNLHSRHQQNVQRMQVQVGHATDAYICHNSVRSSTCEKRKASPASHPCHVNRLQPHVFKAHKGVQRKQRALCLAQATSWAILRRMRCATIGDIVGGVVGRWRVSEPQLQGK